jgi:hypothetical protein
VLIDFVDLLLDNGLNILINQAWRFNWKLINAEGTKMDVNKKILDLVQSVIKI